MRFALDYDGTYTADPKFWGKFIDLVHLSGHEVYIVTMRHAVDDKIHEGPDIHIIYCDGEPKKSVVQRHGVVIDIWIDDHPDGIIHGSSFSVEELERWREGGRVALSR